MKQHLFFSLSLILILGSCSKKNELVLIKGGGFSNRSSNYFGTNLTIDDFYISKYEISQKEWTDIMGNNPSKFKDPDLPVEMVSWYDSIEYCNKRSIKEGLAPYYNINKKIKDPNNNNEYDSVKWIVTINDKANGYRLPLEAEWEFAASCGFMNTSYSYSGSDDIDKVAWYWRNAGNSKLEGDWAWEKIEQNNTKTKPRGLKKANELGLYDMSGNVREWCWDWNDNNGTEPLGRSWRGGGWMGGAFCCETTFRGNFEANGRGPDQGLRICRSFVD